MGVTEHRARVRVAGPTDRAVLCRLFYEFHQFHVRGVPDRLASLGDFDSGDWTELSAAVDAILADEDAVLLVADSAGRVVGMAEVHYREDQPSPARIAHRYGHLQSLMVLEGLRHRGIGTLLLRAAEDWARARGATEMQLDIWEFADGPLGFYEGAGYQVMRRSMVHSIVGSP
jgi:GNAT superfamily N-acetyltransferase